MFVMKEIELILLLSIIVVPQAPSGFRVNERYPTNNMGTIVTLQWDPPQGRDSQTVVDNYTISISPPPLSQPSTTMVNSPPWNVTFDYNVDYELNITAENCNGESDPFTLNIGMCFDVKINSNYIRSI